MTYVFDKRTTYAIIKDIADETKTPIVLLLATLPKDFRYLKVIEEEVTQAIENTSFPETLKDRMKSKGFVTADFIRVIKKHKKDGNYKNIEILTEYTPVVGNTFEDTLDNVGENIRKDFSRDLERKYTEHVEAVFPSFQLVDTKALLNFKKAYIEHIADTHSISFLPRITPYSYCFSAFLSTYSSAPVLPIKEKLQAFSPYREEEILQFLQKIKNKNIKVILVGAGGVGYNFLINICHISEYFNFWELFNHIIIYDNDALDVTNLPRLNSSQFHRNMSSLYKASMLSNEVVTRSINIAENLEWEYCLFDPIPNLTDAKEVIIGAVDLPTRENLYKSDRHFYSFTHYNDEYNITYKPEVTPAVMEETYGQIALEEFFVNIFKGTLEMLRILSEDHPTEKNTLLKREKFNKKEENVFI